MAERRSSWLSTALVVVTFLAGAIFLPGSGVAAPTCTGSVRNGAELADAVEAGQSDIELNPACRYKLSSPIRVESAGTQTRIEGNGATLRGKAASMFVVNAGAALALDGMTIAHDGGERAIVNHGYLRITVSTFSGSDSAAGGAIETDRYTRITDSTFVGNVSGNEGGGAVLNRGGELIVEDSTFSANKSTGTGGAVSNQGVLTMRNATLWGNRAGRGSALANSGTATVTNTIIAGWYGDTLCSGTEPERVSPGNLTDRPDAGCGKDFARVEAMRLGPLEDNGGLTQTHALLGGSPAIDRGDNAECSVADQRSVERPSTRENPCDVGAFEVLRARPPGVNDPPTALDTARVVEQSSTVIDVELAALSSDKETADDDLLYELAGPPPTKGRARVSGSVLSYAVDVGAVGVDSIVYRVTDRAFGCGPSSACGPESAIGTVTITILPSPVPPPVPPSPLPSPTPSPTVSSSPSPTPVPPEGPDLSIEDVTLELIRGGSAAGVRNPVYAAGAGPIVVAAGDSLHLVATVVNYGDEPSAATSMTVVTPGWEGDPIPIAGIPAGSQVDVDESMDAPPGVTEKTMFTVTVDEVEGESDGTNNARPDVVAIRAGEGSTTKIVVIALVALLVVAAAAFGVGNLVRKRRPINSTRSSHQREQGPAVAPSGLIELADQYLGAEPGLPLWAAGTMSERLRSELGEDDRSAPFIATVYWRALMGTRGFRRLLAQAGASSAALEQPEILVVSHAGGTRHDLVLLDPESRLSEPSSTSIRVSSEELVEGWDDALSTPAMKGAARIPGTKFKTSMLSEVLKEICGFAEFGLVVAPKPQILLTHCPSPAWPVGFEDEEPTSSVGAVVVDRDGRTGVTVADHAVRGHEKVMIGGRLGTVISSDAISDSSFVELDVDTRDGVRGGKGPLSGVSPRQMEVVEFDGLRSGKTTTRIVGWDPTILTMESYIQNKIVTDPVTMPGDSGAALIDGEGHVLGFAFYTTGLNSQPAHSGWIWAESVYRAHGLEPGREG